MLNVSDAAAELDKVRDLLVEAARTAERCWQRYLRAAEESDAAKARLAVAIQDMRVAENNYGEACETKGREEASHGN